jgi:hypothetical protein
MAITPSKEFETSTTIPTYPRRKTPTSTSSPKPSNTSITCPPNPFDHDLPDPNLPENYIGRHYDLRDLPQGLEHVGGSIIGDPYIGPRFGLSKMKWQLDRSVLYWLERLVCRDSQGFPYMEIVDAIATPPLSDLLTEAGACFQDDNEVKTVIAFGVYDQEAPFETINGYLAKPYPEIVFAFRVDYEAAKFVELEPDSLMCLEPPGIDSR